ncbi:MAG TPA: BACON domain-containing carbohydrate-binding protein, partial [Candidatus Paceibacterota bacterium]|nr:BACON domain-containing carbohydrate-binding protein [Candidatus Paceibacterota bacterium]
PTNGNAGVVVQFNDTSTGPIDNRLWDYGDGHTLFTTNTAVSNSYAVPGQYSVCLTVFSQSAQDMLCRTNYITVLPCGGGYIIAPSPATCDSAGCSGEITVTADPGCPWNANSQADWLLLGPGGSGPGAVQYTVGSNSACLSRTGTAVIAGHVFSLVQAPGPGSFAISSDEVTCGGNGCNGIVTVSTEPGCAWETSSQAPWIGIGAGGIGPGTVSYAVDENPECAPRTGNATIAGWSLTVNQDPGSGEVALTPPTATCTASGGSGSLHVAAGAGCEWDVYTLAQWVTITSGNKGEGSSDVNYSVAANESNCISRTGTIWVADQSFTLVQDAGAGSYSLNPSTRLSTAAGGHGAVIIAAGTGCQWTASSDSAWLHASGSGFGNGSASYLVDANMGGTRTGYVSIATETLTIIQNAGPPERTGYVVFPILAGDPNVQAHGAAGNGTNFLIAIRGGEGYSGLIVVQRVSPHGDLIGQPISLGRSGGTPNIGFDGTNCLVVWPDEGNGYPNDQIYGQFVSLFGDLIGPPFPISTSAGIKDLNSTRPLVFDGTWYWVAWQYASDEEAASDIYGRWVDPVSGPQGVEIGICTNTGEQTTPVVAASRTNILAAWWNRTAPSPEPWEVAGRFLTRLGDMADIPTISQTNSLDMNPFDAVFNGTNYLVVWSRNLTSNPTNHLYGRFLSPAGVFPGPEFPIVTGTANQVFPMAAFDGANHLVGWSDGNGNIRFLYLTTAGQAMGQEFNVFEPGQGNYPPLYGSVVSTGRRFLSVATMGPGFDDSTDVFGAFIPNSIEPSWLMISNQATRLELTGVPGQDYLFQWATDLLLSNAWSDWFTTNAGNGALNLIGTNPLGQVYYRAIQGSEP